MKVYDAFLFFNELDLLEIRLNLLDPIVDYFVISESTVTFSGKAKPLFFAENRDRYSKFAHKIIHQIVDDTPEDFQNLPYIAQPQSKDDQCVNQIFKWIEADEHIPRELTHWCREYYQRECLHRKLIVCSKHDIVISSDVDEIPDPRILQSLITQCNDNPLYVLRQKEFNYYLNLYKFDNWLGPRLARYKTLSTMPLNEFRRANVNSVYDGFNFVVLECGWHFTSLGGVEKIIEKIESWGHQEFNNDRIKKRVRKNVESGKDIFLRQDGPPLRRVEIKEPEFPAWLVAHQAQYAHLINTTFINGSQKDSLMEWLGKKARKLKRWLWTRLKV